MAKKITAIILAVIMMLSILPISLAANTPTIKVSSAVAIPGETVELFYELEVDGKYVEIYGQKVSTDKLFARFDFYDAYDGYRIDKGTKFTIYGNQADMKLLRTMVYGADKWSTKVLYGNASATGDVLPVATIAFAVLAVAGFVVVSKKRKED